MKIKPITSQEFNSALSPSQAPVIPAASPKATSPESGLDFSTDQSVYVRSSRITDPAFNRHLLPSRGFFYANKKDIIFRPFKVGDLKKLQHFLQTNNISHLIDAIQNCVEPDVDVRELTFDDFLYIVFRIVFDSHPDPKYKFIWNSFYGNDNEITITPSDLEVVDLKYQDLLEQLPNYRELGLTPLLVKSYETYHNNQYKEDEASTTWDEEKTWLYKEIACFLNESSPEAQLQKAEQLEISSDTYQKLALFKQLVKHSIKMELAVTDKKFNPETALVNLAERIEALKSIKESEPDTYQELATNDLMNIENIEAEITRIQDLLNQTQEVRAKDEVTPFRLSLSGLIRPLFT